MRSGLYWKITKDRLNVEAEDQRFNRKGVEGPGEPPADTGLPTPWRFRLKDDDGEVYFYGVAANEDSLEYAYEFGRADAGCTNLEVYYTPIQCPFTAYGNHECRAKGRNVNHWESYIS